MDTADARELLARERERLLRELAALDNQGGEEPSEEQTADRDAGLYNHELSESLSDDLRVELAKIDRAEARIAAGTFGLSIESGVPIPDERLQAVPTAERTVEEQARFDDGR